MGPHLHDYWPFLPEWLPLKSYGFAIAVGFLVAAWLAYRRAKRVGLPGEAVLDFALWAVVAGVAGARLFYIVEYHDQFSGLPFWKYFAFHQGGLVFYGGFLGAIPVCVWFIWRRGMPLGRTLDVLASTIMIGLAFGRIGCFSFGCCYGVPTERAYGIVYPADASAYGHADGGSGGGCRQCGVVFPPEMQAYAHPEIPPGTPLFPSQLLSAATAFFLFVLLSLHFRFLRTRDGETAALLLILYPVNRFLLEFTRADTPVRQGLTAAQWISIFVAAGAAAWLVVLLRRPPPTPSPAPDAATEEGQPPDARQRPTSRSKKRRERKGKG